MDDSLKPIVNLYMSIYANVWHITKDAFDASEAASNLIKVMMEISLENQSKQDKLVGGLADAILKVFSDNGNGGDDSGNNGNDS